MKTWNDMSVTLSTKVGPKCDVILSNFAFRAGVNLHLHGRALPSFCCDGQVLNIAVSVSDLFQRQIINSNADWRTTKYHLWKSSLFIRHGTTLLASPITLDYHAGIMDWPRNLWSPYVVVDVSNIFFGKNQLTVVIKFKY